MSCFTTAREVIWAMGWFHRLSQASWWHHSYSEHLSVIGQSLIGVVLCNTLSSISSPMQGDQMGCMGDLGRRHILIRVIFMYWNGTGEIKTCRQYMCIAKAQHTAALWFCRYMWFDSGKGLYPAIMLMQYVKEGNQHLCSLYRGIMLVGKRMNTERKETDDHDFIRWYYLGQQYFLICFSIILILHFVCGILTKSNQLFVEN